jgi:hypothetical protein
MLKAITAAKKKNDRVDAERIVQTQSPLEVIADRESANQSLSDLGTANGCLVA